MDPCNLETKKCSSQLFGARKKEVDCYFEAEKLFRSNLRREKGGSLLLGDPNFFFLQIFGAGKNSMTVISNQKKRFTAICREKKVESCYLEPEKCISQLFGARKRRITAISGHKNCFTAIWWKKKMDSSYLEVKKTSSQLFGA